MTESSANVNPEPSVDKPSSVRLSITCKYCTRDVSRNFHIICAEPVCVNSKGGVRLCGDCLHLSIATHLPSHPYTVVDCMQIPIFSKDWTILEELVLLAGIDKHGMGNWKTIGESMGLGRTAKQIEEHYFEKYMGVHGYCLPAKTILHNKQSPNLTGVGGKLQFVETEATFFSKPSRDASNMDESRSEAAVAMPSATNEEPATTAVESEQSHASAEDDKPTDTSVLNVEVVPDQMDEEPLSLDVDISKEEAHVSDQPEEAADAIPEEEPAGDLTLIDDADEFPAGAAVSGCRIQVTQGYTRGTTVLRDVEVDRALSGYAFSDGVDSSALTGPQSSMKAGGPANTEAGVRERLAQLPGADLPGFIPLREDFDVEHANDAELLLAEMEFNVSDHPSERELKLQVIRIYNEKLDERNRRKRFVIDRCLVDMKHLQTQERRRTKEERESVGRLRPLSRFSSAAEHDALVEGVLRARRLKMQIELLRQYRSMGIRSLEQARLYEIDKRNRQKDQKLRKHREGATHIFGAQSDSDKTGGMDDLVGFLGKRSRRREQLSAFDVAAGMSEMSRDDEEEEFESSTTIAKANKETPLPPTEKRRGRKPNALKQIAVVADNDDDYVDEDEVGGSRPNPISSSTRRRRGNDDNNDEGLEKNTLRRRNSSQQPSLTKESPEEELAKNLQVVMGAPAAELLTDQEAQLCAMVPMLPLHYLAAKEAIVREAFRNGSLTQEGLQRVVVSNDQVSRNFFDFFVRELRVNEPNPALLRRPTSTANNTTTTTSTSSSADSATPMEGDLTQSEPMQVAEDMS